MKITQVFFNAESLDCICMKGLVLLRWQAITWNWLLCSTMSYAVTRPQWAKFLETGASDA